jgi:hypothetical protein
VIGVTAALSSGITGEASSPVYFFLFKLFHTKISGVINKAEHGHFGRCNAGQIMFKGFLPINSSNNTYSNNTVKRSSFVMP